MGASARRARAAWERFWFEPESTATLVLVRIAFGTLAFLWGLSLLPDLFTFFGPDGILAEQPTDQGPGTWGLLGIVNSDAAVLVVYLGLLLGAVALVLGLWSRLAALVVFLALLSFTRRDPFVLNSGDGLIRIIALLLVLSPVGVAVSLDRLRTARDRLWEFPARAPWTLRLLQLQLSFIYVSTVWQKVRGTSWNDGTAVSYALRIDDLQRFPAPAFFTDSLTLSNLATFGTLAIELSLGLLVWNRVARPYVLALGVGCT